MSRTRFKAGYTKLSLAFREAVEEIRSVRTVPASSSGFRVSRFAALGCRVFGVFGICSEWAFRHRRDVQLEWGPAERYLQVQ